LTYWAEYQKQIEILKSETNKIYEALVKIPNIRVFPTRANFVLFQAADAETWSKELLSKGIAVRYMGNLPGLSSCLRVSTGLPAENDLFIAAIRDIAARREGKIACG